MIDDWSKNFLNKYLLYIFTSDVKLDYLVLLYDSFLIISINLYDQLKKHKEDNYIGYAIPFHWIRFKDNIIRMKSRYTQSKTLH